MPRLPELPELSDEHFALIASAFPGDTDAEKAEAYINWSLNNLIDRVEMLEVRRITEQAEAMRIAAIMEVRQALPPRQRFDDFDTRVEP